MNVLSLFDGMGCGAIALKELGFDFTYYSSEVDKFATAQSKLNFPDSIQLGDVRNIDPANLPKIDLIIGGSPCQSFSFAGKRKGMATKQAEEIYTLERYLELKEQGFEFEGQSYLFWEYMRILVEVRKVNPGVLFLLENVVMVKKWERVLSQAIGIFGVHINSNLVSAQNRSRIYWTNIRTKKIGLFGELYSDIPQPQDRGILLKDILQPESQVDEKYYLSDKAIQAFNLGIKGNKKTKEDKAGCLTAGAHSGGNHSDMDILCVSMVGRKINDQGKRDNYNPKLKAVQRLEPTQDPNKTNCLTSVQKDNLILTKADKRLIKNTRTKDQKAQCLLSTSCKGPWANGTTLIKQNFKLRRLTPTECARLQTVPDWYKWACSDTQKYRQLGNGWTVEVIKHIFSFITK